MSLTSALYRLALAVLVLAAISCSGDGASYPSYLRPLAVDVCDQLKDDSPLSYQAPGQAPNAPDYVVEGMSTAFDLGHEHDEIVSVQEYSDALKAECPRTIERFLCTDSYEDWMGGEYGRCY